MFDPRRRLELLGCDLPRRRRRVERFEAAHVVARSDGGRRAAATPLHGAAVGVLRVLLVELDVAEVQQAVHARPRLDDALFAAAKQRGGRLLARRLKELLQPLRGLLVVSGVVDALRLHCAAAEEGKALRGRLEPLAALLLGPRAPLVQRMERALARGVVHEPRLLKEVRLDGAAAPAC